MKPNLTPAVTLITPLDGGLASNGTGFVIANGPAGATVLTCSHVVGHDKHAKILVNGRPPSEIETGYEFGLDLALLTVPELNAPVVKIGGLDLTDETLRYIGYSKLYVDDYMRTGVDVRLVRALDLQHARARQSFLAYEIDATREGGIQPGHSGAPLILGGEAVGVVSHRLGDGKRGLVLALRAALRQWPSAQAIVGVEGDSEGKETPLTVNLRVAGPPKVKFPPPPLPTDLDPEDNNQGRFGGSESDGYRLRAALKNARGRSFFVFDLIVERIDGSPITVEDAKFFLHSSFDPSRYVVRGKEGAPDIRLEDITSYGVFTAGAQVRTASGKFITLGYNVAFLTGLPQAFKSK